MRAKKITAYYEVDPWGKIKRPSLGVKKRVKDLWDWARRIASDDKTTVVVRMDLYVYSGTVAEKRAFFEGAIVYYYEAQRIGREPTPTELANARRYILGELLTVTSVRPHGLRPIIRNNEEEPYKERISTTTFDLEQWEFFFEACDQGLFVPAGFAFPDRAEFRRLVTPRNEGGEGMSREQATRHLHERLLNIIKDRQNIV